MFPYADKAEDYWTGYFTSRPNAKKQVRDGQGLLHATSKYFALKAINATVHEDDLQAMLDTK